MMDFLEDLVEKHRTKHPRTHDEHGQYPVRSHPEADNGNPWPAPEHEHERNHVVRHDPHGRLGLQAGIGALAQHKTLLVVAALLLLVVAIGGILALVVLLPLVGTLLASVGATDLTGLLTDVPRPLTTLLVDAPKAILEYLAPLLQLKDALEGKA